jgi:LuxR family maltose regulon positive regulatory protein
MRSESVASLFAARLSVPRPLVRVSTRRRVVALLDDAVRDHPLSLVVGGAGTGKTFAVADWTIHGHPPGPVAWVSLDRGLRHPPRFWAALLEAIRSVVDSEALGSLALPPTADDDFVQSFAAGLDGQDLCIVLDDVHELDGSQIWDGLDLLVSRLPAGCHLVLLARHDPPLALYRLRVAGALGEIRAGDLAFSEAEARQLVEDRGIHLAPEQLAPLMETTEGWAAGLRLALMTLEASADPAEAAKRFSGRVKVVAGYVMDEVVRNLDPESAELLRRTSICDRMCGPLARTLAADPSAAPGPLDLSRWSPFVVELDDSGWYRYHPLLLQTLRAQLHAQAPELERELHRRAALWFEDNGEWLAALEHALATEDWDLVAVIALRSAAVRIFSSERRELATLIDLIPPHVAHGRADLELVRAMGALCRDDHVAEAALLRGVSDGLDDLAEPVRTLATLNLRVLQAAAARRAGDAGAMTEAAKQAATIGRRLTSEEAPGWATYRGSAEALEAIGELWSGNPGRAQQLMRQAVAQARPADVDDFGAVYYQGHYAVAEHALGRVASARAIALGAVQIARRTGNDVRHEARAAHLALAAAEVQRGKPDAAAAALDAGAAAAARGDDPFVRARLRVVAARRSLLLNDLAGARRHLAEIPPFLVTYPRMALVTRQHAGLGVEVELAAGAVDRAAEVLREYDAATGASGSPMPGEPDPLAVPRARVLLARGSAAEVRHWLSGQLELEGTMGAEAWVTVALAEDHLRHETATTEALARAIDLAAPEEATLPFLRPRDHLSRRLRRHLEVVGSHRDFVSGLLEALADPALQETQARPASEPLTDRELSVLSYLPGMSSNEEIAEGLGISVNTVKQHLKAINRKLGVGSRRDAFRAARDLGLLSTPLSSSAAG